MAFIKRTKFHMKWRTLLNVTFLIILQVLTVSSQINDPGGTPDIITVSYDIREGLSKDSYVGTLPIKTGYLYQIQDQQNLFNLDGNSGIITTKIVIDREQLSQNTQSFFVTGTSTISSSDPQHPINVRVTILDENDNAPTFPHPTATIQFYENVVVGQVPLTTASDPDDGENGRVSNYNIVSRDDDNKFDVIYNSSLYGEVLIVKNLDKLNREERSSYQINVSVQDNGKPPKYGYLQIFIQVEDVNDNPPIFDQSQYDAIINESAPIGTLVIHVAASDDDTGINSEITYSLLDDSNQFEIDSKTGEIKTTKTPLYCYQRCDRSASTDILDKCEPYSCVLTVTTVDGGTPSLSGRAYVAVKVVDENNHAPTISIRNFPDSKQPHSTVSENANTPVTVALVTVSDADTGTSISSVSIVSGNEKGHFEMITSADFKYSSVRLVGMLDRERVSMYNLTIKALDSGNPPKSSVAFLVVYVIDVNDHVPQFTKLEYRLTLSETLTIGSYVESVTAHDEDSGQNADLTYSVISGNELGWFKLNEKTGLLTVNAQMHYDMAFQIVMNISVHDGGPKPFYNFTKVIISIFDENDRTPEFISSTFDRTIDENLPAGYEILKATATDKDSGLNGTVVYELHRDVQIRYPNTFSININDGKLTTQKMLDRELVSFYEIKLIAKDQGIKPLSSTATVNLNIADQNDNKPVFYPEKYFINFESSQPIGTFVVQVSAKDIDFGINAKIIYSFVSSYPAFAIDSESGRITTTQVIDPNLQNVYMLQVSATDSDPSHASDNRANVRITFVSPADVAPTFQNLPFKFTLTEDTGTGMNPVSKNIGSIRASVPGKIVQYAIVDGDSEKVFRISDIGDITAVKRIDREVQSLYNLKVLAYTDSKSSEENVQIVVQDVNDHAPIFLNNENEVLVAENLPMGHEVYLGAASDLDDGMNAVITYALEPASNIFKIDVNTGVISLATSIQKLNNVDKLYQLTITATDGGNSPQLKSSQQVTMVIEDVNDHTPIFPHSGYEFSLNESVPVNEQFLVLQAIDQDYGENARITYNITRGNGESAFGIFPNGALFVAKQLDRETRDHYQLTIVASDNGVERRSSAVNVTINILDNNDNKPLFINTTYTMSIKENNPVQSLIGSVSATDADIGRNAELSYFLVTGEDYFSIDVQTGEIRSKKVFDREQLFETTGKTFLTIEVMTTDNGLNKLQDRATVDVYIMDVNDNAPVFEKTIYRAALKENDAKYSPIVKVLATDKDSDENQALTYMIIAGNEDLQFDINSGNGQISLVGFVDRESQDSYTLQVMATDSGFTNQHSATCTVSIAIKDVNDNSPLFAQSVYEIVVSEYTVVGKEIIQFSATDNDLGINAQIIYSVTGADNTFIIDANTGKLYLDRSLDYETKKEYKLTISASDKGTPSVLPSVSVLTVKVTDENDNAPKFINSPNYATITENANSYHSIMKVTAQDDDYGLNGQVVYSILNEEPVANMFTIDADQGKISFSGTDLDREKVSSYTLTVIASDKAISDKKSAQHTIVISVTDENDNAPVFISSNAVQLSYPAITGYFATVRAEDPDEGNNGRVTYSLLTQMSYFSIDSTSGRLSLITSLSSSPGTYTLRVKASDNGNSPKSKEMDVTVVLVPSSEDGPNFENSPYSVQIQENEGISRSLLRLNTNPNTNVKFYVTGINTSGKLDQLFQVDETTGVFSAAKGIDREIHGSSINVDVCAVQTSQSSPKAKCTQVAITVQDVNDTPPIFSKNLYTQLVSEGAPVGTKVSNLTVTDEDTVGVLSLIIKSGSDGVFTINNLGQISVSSQLDREKKEKHTLVVEASDGAQSSTATVIITITDINDEPPVFVRPLYTFDVPENTAVGTTLGRVEATDADEGDNGEVFYSLISTWGSDLFLLDLNKGTFTLRGNLDFEQTQLYTLKVKAEDRGNPKLTATVTVFMNVKDTNDNEPVFDPQSYSVEVKEDVAIGTKVAMVSATDIDSGLNGKVHYEIFDGDFFNQFEVGRENGTLFTRKDLDREAIPSYDLTILAIDQAESPDIRRSTSTQVTIVIKDVNDNAPVFITPSVMSVSEDRPINSIAFVVMVEDKDLGNNSDIIFSLSYHPNPPFRINPKTGEMVVNTALDRETTPNYTVTVTAFDHGSPAKSTVQSLTIKINDVNDNDPVFYPTSYSKVIPENTEIGKTLITVTATDRDEGLNGNVRYFIVEGDDNFDFTIDQSSGVIRVQKELDYERVQAYTLKVQAEDSGSVTRSAYTDVTITILDYNDEKPVFVNSPYYPLVQEEAEILPVHVLQVSARDEDSEVNNKVTYEFREGDKVDGEVVFQMNNTSGEIICLKKLDREQVEEYRLIIVAFDSGLPQRTGTGTVIVTVQDVNDHGPEFEHSSVYIGHIEENLQGDSQILTVKATDKDEGQNAQVIYSLENTFDGKFSIHPTKGELMGAKSLDREEQDSYQLKVIARDNSLLPKQAIADVTVVVDDKNDNTPQFEKQNYQQTVNNPTQIGEFVLGVTALDRDIGGNGQVIYTLIGSDKFMINSNTGIITAKQTLNVARETYTCVIKAEDQGNPRKSSLANVTITVSDISSSNKPTFTSFQTPQSLEENKPVDFSVITIQAVSSGGGAVKYYIAGGNVGHSFRIGETSGEVKVLKPVDYEMTQSFDLWIEARDATNMALSAFRKLVITVQDLNDNAPRFSQPLHTPSILENAPVGSTVIQIMATDSDAGNNGAISYRLVPEDSTFNIDQSSGVITTKVSLDRETVDVYSLVVEAIDQGATPQTGSTTVRIIIEDVNDRNPIFSRNFNIEIPEDLAIGSFIIQVTTSDADIGENAKVTYAIVDNPEEKFKIDSDSGNITLHGKLDAEIHGGPNNQGMQIKISASDKAHLTYGFVNVRITDVNDNAPVFTPSLTFSLIEGLPAGTSVGRVKAVDADVSYPNNRTYYSFKLSSSEFSIDSSSGEITSKVEMAYIHTTDYPNINSRELVVIATDFGTPPKSSEAIVNIHITDANDHTPVFEPRDYFSAVPINVRVSDHVMTVVAVDNLDYGLNAEVEYYKNGGTGASYFYVNRISGNITIASTLEGQQNKDFTLFVTAQDKGTPPKNVTQEIRFRITGINQYSPVFTTTTLQAEIPENTIIGSSIASVSANDNDISGPNGEVTYHIVDGDPKNLFSIDRTRGSISVRLPLDYETTKQHGLTIMARDQGLYYRNATVIFVVNIKDVNDNYPVFNSSNFIVSVNENTPAGMVITTITATDADSGNNANIEYSFGHTQTSDLFTMDRFTGSIKTKASLNYEMTTSYSIIVVGVNPGTNFKNTTEVLIEVNGVNEFYPKFVEKNYAFSIKESIAIDTVLGSVVATDDDAGEDGVVYYYLIGSSNTKGFKVDYKSGEVIVVGRPDYESSPNIILTVMAKNWGSIKGGDTDECTITITVEDANDPPVFSKQLYIASVPENSGAGVSVKNVVATDTDHNPSDQIFSYVILYGNDEGLFQINQVNGLVSTTGAGVLDRERQALYNVTVGAVDTGAVPQTGSALLQVTLTDVNDNGPIFMSNNVTGYVTENQNSEVSIITLQEFTSDPDLPPNQGPYRYRLLTPNEYFKIDAVSGLVTSRNPVDREQIPRFEMDVVISDGGSPTQSSTLTFTVEVQDQNDTPPSPRNMKVQVALFDGRIPTGPIADVRPIDPDIIGQYVCTISTAQNIFYISTGCKLNIINRPNSPTTISILGSDGGQHGKVSYTASFEFLPFSNVTLERTVILKIRKEISAEKFVDSKMENMKQYLSRVFGSTYSIMIYSVKGTNEGTLLYLAVAKDNTFLLHDILKQQIVNIKTDMETELGITITNVGYSPCSSSTCNSGECLNRIDVGNMVNAVDSNHLIVSSPDLTVSYYCSCPPQFTGTHCEVAVSPCGSGHCQNGGFCTSASVCDCPSGWTGTYCQTDVNECLNSPCQNKGICNNTQGSFKCHCKDGFTGELCEFGSDHCSPNPCINGVCKNLVEGYSCQCPFTYWGDRCEQTSVGFSTGSFKEFPSLSTATNDNTFDLIFSTVKSRALLLYNTAELKESREFLALEIINSQVRFSFNLGDIQTTRLTVPINVSTGDWFSVQVHRSGETAQLSVSQCDKNGGVCPACTDSYCSKTGTQQSKQLNLGNEAVTIGGIDDINVALEHPGQIESHDFVGCMRYFKINNEDYLHSKTATNEQGVDNNSCPRQQGQSACSGFVCHNGGRCVDEWSTASCRCAPGFHGLRCKEEFKPFGFGPNSYVEFKQKESYQRDGLLTSARRRRASGTSSIFLRFRTTNPKGLLFLAERGTQSAVLYIESNSLKYTIKDDASKSENTIMVQNSAISDGKWHNATVIITGTTVLLTLDLKSSSEDNVQSAFMFSDVYVTVMSLGGATKPVYVNSNANELSGFGGCLSEFELDEAAVPLNGTTDRFVIETSSNVENGCSGLCTSAGCQGSCTFDGEVAKCAIVNEDEPLGIGVIVVIVFFAVLLIVIVVIFFAYRCYRQRRGDVGKQNGHVNKSFGSGHSPEDSGYGDTEIISRHVSQTLNQSNHYAVSNGRLPPDVVNGDSGRRSALHMEDGTVILDNGDFHIPQNEDSPELYDLENASSIAPSDIDVSYYYGAARNGRGPSYRNNFNQRNMLPNSNGHGPPSHHYNSGSRESPGALRMQTTAMQNRHSPANALSNQHLNPPNRYSPASSYGQRNSPMNQLNRQSPNSRASPLVQANVRGTPDIHHGRADSDHSIVSHHSHHSISSTSSVSRIGPLPNGHIKHSTGKRPVPGNRIPNNNPRSVKGLTLEEIDKLNAKPSRPSPVSLLEAVSSSEEGHRRNHQFKIKDHLDDGAMLEPLDSSSDESANDSFTCSEFEYENDKGRSDFDPSAMIYSKLAEVDNENDELHANHNFRNDGLDSNGSSFASSEEGRRNGAPINGAINWDYFTDWGPSFEKLVGVFKDIASLPDGDVNTNSNMDCRTETEEYV